MRRQPIREKPSTRALKQNDSPDFIGKMVLLPMRAGAAVVFITRKFRIRQKRFPA